MSVTEDRRRITFRLHDAAGGGRRRVRRPGDQLLVPPGRPAQAATRRWPRTTTSGRSRCARRAACCSTATARCSSRTGTRSPSRSSASTRKDLDAHDPPAVGGRRPRSEAGASRSSSATAASRPTARSSIVEDASLAQVAAVTRAAPRVRAARRRRRGSADAAISRPTRWPRTCSATSARPTTRRWRAASTQGAIVGQPGVEKVYNTLLMGADGARRVVVNSVGREIRTLEEVPPVEGRRVQLTIDYDLQKAAEDGFRHAGFNGAALILDPRNGEVLTYASLPAYDPNDFAVGHRPRDVGVAEHRQAAAAAEPRACRAATRRARPSRSSWRRRRSRKGSSTPDFRVTCNGGAYVLRPLLQVPPQGRPRLGGHAPRASRSRATSTSTRSATCSASTRSTSGPRSSGMVGQDRHRSAERAGEPRARPPSGS